MNQSPPNRVNQGEDIRIRAELLGESVGFDLTGDVNNPHLYTQSGVQRADLNDASATAPWDVPIIVVPAPWTEAPCRAPPPRRC